MRWVGAFAFGVVLVMSTPCPADDKADCVAAYSNAQDLRQATKLGAAKQQLEVCAHAVCPSFISRDCTAWLAEVVTTMPTIVLAAKDESGRDVTDVHVVMDGKAITDRLDGTAIDVDPGTHTLEFRRDGYTTVSERIVARTAEKNREVAVTLTPVSRRLEPIVPVATSKHRPLTTVAIVLGVVGALGLVTGTVTGIAAIATKDAHCPMGVCESGTLSTLWSESSVATLSLISGGVLLTLGVVLFLVGRSEHKVASFERDFAYRF
jgi:hypothetical protein